MLPFAGLIATVFFFRGEWLFASLSTSYLIPFFALISLAVSLVKLIFDGHIMLPKNATIFFFFLWIISLLISIVFRSEGGLIRFVLEVSLNITIYLACYYVICSRQVDLKMLQTVILWTGLPLVAVYIITMLDMDTIRRIKGFGAVNHLGHSFAILGTISLYQLYNSRNKRSMAAWSIIFLLFFSVMILTGTRSAIAGFILAAGMLLASRGFMPFIKYSLVITIMIGALVLILPQVKNVSLLSARFAPDQIVFNSGSLGKRMAIWHSTVEQITLKGFFVGLPDFYDAAVDNVVDIEYRNPHNLWLSLLFYNGVIVLICSLYALLRTIRKCWTLLPRSPGNRHDDMILVLSLFLITLVYASLSGQYTRIMTIFVFWGVIDAMYVVRQTSRSCRSDGMQSCRPSDRERAEV